MRIAGHLGQQIRPTQLSYLLPPDPGIKGVWLEDPMSTKVSTLGSGSILFPPGLYKKHGLGTWPHWTGTQSLAAWNWSTMQSDIEQVSTTLLLSTPVTTGN